ncbi:MAG: catalase [Myxococcaceae bacterium]|nr:catalase [Myxococcaceae bacterium]
MSFSTDWKETVDPGEKARFEMLSKQITDIQKRRMERAGQPFRAVHRKAIAAAKAELRIGNDAPEALRVGLFKAPATHACWVRFSNGSGSHQADRKQDVRGIAVKVFDVPGPKALPGAQATTQDFLAIQIPATPFKNAEEFVAFVRGAAQPATLLPKLVGEFGLVATVKMVAKLAGTARYKVDSFATARFFSALPIRFGPYAVKYAFVPRQEAGAAVAHTGDDFYRADLVKRLAAGPLLYDLKVQPFVDEKRTPIENAAIEWRESDSAYLKVAELYLPQQDIASAEGGALAERVEAASFDPWHALEEHRPLGAMMRARGVAYFDSTQQRKAAAEP